MTTYEKVMSIIAEPMGWILSMLYEFIGSYGLSLIVFTIIVRTAILPLYASQLKSSERMKEFQPKMKDIQKKYAHDKELLNMKLMELYKEEKYNPMSGCLPMIIQMPIILSFFVLLRNPLAFISDPQMLMAVHESFLWVPDLSQPDPWIFPILAGIATFFSFSLTQAMAPAADMGGAGAMMKMMRYFFPVMIVWMGRTFPAGLTLYWFIGTLYMIGQTLIMRKLKEKKASRREFAKNKA